MLISIANSVLFMQKCEKLGFRVMVKGWLSIFAAATYGPLG